jgi:transposase InsO family protein
MVHNLGFCSRTSFNPIEAITVANKLVDRVISILGVPMEIHSDQSSNFKSKVFKEICKLLGLHKTRTTSLRPQSDGMVEKFNATIENINY